MKKVIGMDLGDKQHVVVVFSEEGEELETRSVGNTQRQVERLSARYPEAVVVMEAGTHSAWISRLLKSRGHEVLVGNPRKLRAIWDSDDKSDERDARILGLMYRLEPRLLHGVVHRGEQAQLDLTVIKARLQLVACRSKLIAHVRSVAKGFGYRLPSSSAEAFVKRALAHLPESLMTAMTPVLETIQTLNQKVGRQDDQIEKLGQERYPETARLQQVPGVGRLTALAYVLTLEDPSRFADSRAVGPFLGLTPRRDQSGQTDRQLPITKAGNPYLRQLLVNCAHYILGPFGPDCDLRRYGRRIAARGGKNAKKRAIVAVARKLAVLLHRLWADGAAYQPIKGKVEQRAA